MKIYCVFEEYHYRGDEWHDLQRIFSTKEAAEMHAGELARVPNIGENTTYYVREREVFE